MDSALLRLSSNDVFTVRDACQGVAVFGSIGSGKTSGSGQALATAYLRAGFGGLVLCAKPDEVTLWRRYAAMSGRQASLIEWNGANHGFNFVTYELARQGSAGLNSVVECLLRVVEAARLAGPTPGRSGDSFWEDTTRQLLRNTIPVLYAAYRSISIPQICEFVRSAPRSLQEMDDEGWQSRSFMFATSAKAGPQIGPEAGRMLLGYWRGDFAVLDSKTRGNIVTSLTTTLDRFNHGWLAPAFCGQTTLVPELCFHGVLIVLDMPALTRNEDGIIAQQLFKYMWQRAVLSRNALDAGQRERPVFLWADEAQYFVNSYDAEFQSTCRSSRACTVYLSQSLPTYYARMSGENARDRVHHLLGNFGTKIFHSNACPETNEWAARTLGRVLKRRETYNETDGSSTSYGMNRGSNVNRGSQSGSGGSSGPDGRTSGSWNYGNSYGTGESWGEQRGGGTSTGTSYGYSEQMDHLIEPAQFGRMLKTGGPANGNRVSAVWYQAGRSFTDSGSNMLLTTFAQ